jgi:hypothetical protein
MCAKRFNGKKMSHGKKDLPRPTKDVRVIPKQPKKKEKTRGQPQP